MTEQPIKGLVVPDDYRGLEMERVWIEECVEMTDEQLKGWGDAAGVALKKKDWLMHHKHDTDISGWKNQSDKTLWGMRGATVTEEKSMSTDTNQAASDAASTPVKPSWDEFWKIAREMDRQSFVGYMAGVSPPVTNENTAPEIQLKTGDRINGTLYGTNRDDGSPVFTVSDTSITMPTEINRLLADLCDEIAILRQWHETLESRLGPVLASEPVSAVTAPARLIPQTDVGVRMNELVLTVMEMSKRLSGVISRLGI